MNKFDTFLLRAREHLRKHPDEEHGLVVARDFSTTPIVNEAPEAERHRLIIQDMESFQTMVHLYMHENLYGWVHSHPVGPPVPSLMDIDKHKVCCTMGIYSIPLDQFAFYPSRSVTRMKNALQRDQVAPSDCSVFIRGLSCGIRRFSFDKGSGTFTQA